MYEYDDNGYCAADQGEWWPEPEPMPASTCSTRWLRQSRSRALARESGAPRALRGVT